VREYLHQRHGVTADMVAIKTSEKDELKEVDDVGGLLSRDCPIRYIITKQALQEGWDCPFAYVLAVLTNPSSKTALTQLVGRILRQPDGRKTGNHWLDESYVFCFQRKGAALLQDREKILQEEEVAAHGERLEIADDEEPDCAFAASHLLDVMPNPWRGNQIAREVFASLAKRYERRRILDSYVFVLDEIHRRLLEERDRLARQVFHELLENGTMRFMVVTDEFAFRLPKVMAMPEREPRANSEIGKQYQLSELLARPE
jgi:superfamily II DNA or RNA helicase